MASGTTMLLVPWLMASSALACGSDPDADSPSFARAREAMVASQIEARGIRDRATLEAMRKVPRHLFVPKDVRDAAYEDHPLEPQLPVFDLGDVLKLGGQSGHAAQRLALLKIHIAGLELVERGVFVHSCHL